MKLLISVPTKPDGSLNHALVGFLLEAQAAGHAIDRVACRPTAAGRNEQIRRFLWAFDHDLLLCVDDDMVPGMDGLALMLEEIASTDVDVLAALTLRQDRGGPTPVILELTEDHSGSKLHMGILDRPPGLHEVKRGVVPGACVMAKRPALLRFHEKGRVWHKDVLHDGSVEHHVLQEILDAAAGDPAKAVRKLSSVLAHERRDFNRDTVGIREWGHDAWFCRSCAELGLRVWIDTRILWGHMKSTDLRLLLSLLNEVRRAKGAADAR